MPEILLLNPAKRRSRKASTKRRSRKHRTAAQRAATKRMLAARFGARHNPAPARKSRKRRSVKRSSAVSRVRRHFSGMRATGAMTMVKAGAIGGAGAVANDVLFGYVSKVLPANMLAPVNADGSVNYLNLAAKAATAIALGTYGRRLPVIGKHAPQMAEGALTVMSYGLIRSMLPASVALGAYNPVPAFARPRGMGVYANARLGAYADTGSNVRPMPQVRANPEIGAGARAAMAMAR